MPADLHTRRVILVANETAGGAVLTPASASGCGPARPRCSSSHRR